MTDNAIWSLSTTAASNAGADSTISCAEGQTPGSVNNGIRGALARLRAYVQLLGGRASTGSADAYVYASPSGHALTSYVQDQQVIFKANFTNSGAATINIDTVGAATIKKGGTTDLAAGDIVSGKVYHLVYDGSNFQVIGGLGSGSYQPLDATLTALAAPTITANSLILGTGTDAFSVVTQLPYGTGSAANPSYSFAGRLTDGMWSPASNQLRLGVNSGATSFDIVGGLGVLVGSYQASNGSLSFPGYGFSADADNGMRRIGTNNIGLVAGGADAIDINTTRALLAVDAVLPAAGPTSTLSAGYRGTPTATQNSAYGFVLADAGTTVYHDEVTARTYTIPANASVAFPIGTTIIIDNTGNSGAAGAITLSITSDTLRRGDGTSGTGSRTIAASSVIAIRKVTSTIWVATGAGLS